jgi:hypothetical protein
MTNTWEIFAGTADPVVAPVRTPRLAWFDGDEVHATAANTSVDRSSTK